MSQSLLLITTKEILWQQLVLIPTCFSDCLKCCLCTFIIKPSLFLLLLCHQTQNLVTDTEWSPHLLGCYLTGLILLYLFVTDEGGESWLVPLRIHQYCLLSMGLQAIPLCAVVLLLCHKTSTLLESYHPSQVNGKWTAPSDYPKILLDWEGDKEAKSRGPTEGQPSSKFHIWKWLKPERLPRACRRSKHSEKQDTGTCLPVVLPGLHNGKVTMLQHCLWVTTEPSPP